VDLIVPPLLALLLATLLQLNFQELKNVSYS
jgi:hypothetical protein